MEKVICDMQKSTSIPPPKKISICIPVFNEGENLAVAVKAVESVFTKELSNYQLELIITDNASTDNTWEIANNLSKSRPYLKAFRFSRNFGYQNSVYAGLCLSTGDAIIEMDADLEDPPAVIPEFIHQWEQGYEVVYGVRTKRYNPLWQTLLFHLFYRLLNQLSEIHIPINAGDFRLIDRKIVECLMELPERNLYLRGLVNYLGFRQKSVPYERNPRTAGKSKFNTKQYVMLSIDAITAFTKTPLRLIGLFGFLLFIASAALGSYYLISQLLYSTPVAGFSTLVVLTLFLHSITFMFLGILGEYLSRIFDDSKKRPRIIIAETINSDKPLPTIL